MNLAYQPRLFLVNTIHNCDIKELCWTIKKAVKETEVAQSCTTLCNPIDCSLPDFSVNGIFQAKVWEWDVFPFSRGSSQPGDQTKVSHTAGRCIIYLLSYEGSHHKESRVPKNSCFWTVVLEKTLESPLDYIQSILREISPEYSLEGLMLKLQLQYFGHLMRRVDSLEKTLMLGGIGGRRRRGDNRGWDGWMTSLTWWAWVWVDSGSWWWTGRPGVLWFMESQRVRHDWATELNWSQLYTNAKGTSLGRKHKRRKRSVENKPKTI